ncbi:MULTISPECIES: (2Fe-2S)-binding protein [unclassified Streptomyces]|uniref:(2Fe-2S)-binding protein n=1 Tax=Streptomyces TaxID=1883 RepID=UPI001955075B|nr:MULTISPECIES: (2Fe-2S)-binding protein [unclassified Streptomyces]
MSEATRGRRRSPRDLVGGTPTATWSLRFDGRELSAQAGQSIAAVLWSAGILAWRTTRETGAPRGAFCGIGSCYDCLVTVNGRPNQRACLVPARPGDRVTTQEGTGHGDLAV